MTSYPNTKQNIERTHTLEVVQEKKTLKTQNEVYVVDTLDEKVISKWNVDT